MRSARIAGGLDGPTYQRHQPEKTLLYQIITQHYPVFKETLEAQGRSLPKYVQREFDEFLICGRLEHGFLRIRCEDCHHERLVTFSCKRRGFCPSCGARRMAESAALLTDVAYLVAKARNYTSYEIVKEQIGPKRSLLKDVSLVNHIDKIQVPVLLIHGEGDRSVRVHHSRKMNRRLKKAGKDVTYLEIEDGNHCFSKQSHRIATFKAMDAFLEKHLPVQ